MHRAPHFRAVSDAARVIVSGSSHFFGGHRVAGEPGEGVFGAWEWTGAELIAQVDSYGAYPLFYAAYPDGVVISPSLLTLVDIGVAPDLDDEALAAFLRLGFFLGEDTPLRVARVLPPGGRLRWRAGTLHVTGGPFFAQASTYSRDDAIDAFNAAFRRSIERRLAPGHRVLLPLSGGRDSRHILLALCDAGAPPDACVTVRPFPPRAHLEVPVASAVAALARVPHVVVEQSGPRVDAERRKNVLTHFCSDEHAHFVALAHYLSAHADTSYDGLAGDMLTGQSGSLETGLVRLLDEERFDAAAARLFEGYEKHGIERALAGLLPPSLYRRFNRDAAVARVRRELARHSAAPHRAMSFLFWNRTRRELALAPYAMTADVQVFSPYLDRAIVDLTMGLSPGTTLDHRLHTHAIQRAYPRAAHIPFEHGDPTAAPRSFVARTAWDLMGAVLSRSAAVRRRYVLPRLAAAALTGQSAYLWFLPLVMYVSQLCDVRRVAGRAASR